MAGYRVYRQNIDEKNKILELWVRRKRGHSKLECSGCGRKFPDAYDSRERAVRDLPWSEFRTTVHIEVYRVKCPDCGVKVEKVPLLPSKAPFSKRFEDAVGQACKGASVRQVARRVGFAGEYGARDRSAVSGAMGCDQAQATTPADGGGRDSPGEETEVPHGGVQSGNERAAMVRPGAKEGILRRRPCRAVNSP